MLAVKEYKPESCGFKKSAFLFMLPSNLHARYAFVYIYDPAELYVFSESLLNCNSYLVLSCTDRNISVIN